MQLSSLLIPGTNLFLLFARLGESGRLETCEHKLISVHLPQRPSIIVTNRFDAGN
jgi:hypothetical protein